MMKTRNKPLPEKVAKDYFRQTLRGLRELKRKNICHRDLSLENLMFDQENKIQIIDFGMCLQIPTYQVTHVVPYDVEMDYSHKVFAEQMAIMINDGKNVVSGGLLIASPTETEVDHRSPIDDDNCFNPPYTHEGQDGPYTKDSFNDGMNCNQSMFGLESRDPCGEEFFWTNANQSQGEGQENANIGESNNNGNKRSTKVPQPPLQNESISMEDDLDTIVDNNLHNSYHQHKKQSHRTQQQQRQQQQQQQNQEQEGETPLQKKPSASAFSCGTPIGIPSTRANSLLSSVGGSPISEYVEKEHLSKSDNNINNMNNIDNLQKVQEREQNTHHPIASQCHLVKEQGQANTNTNAYVQMNHMRQIQQFRTIIETKHAWCKEEARRGKANYICPEIADERPFDGFAVDMWSVGIILYIMLTVTPLYASSNDKAFELILNGELDRLLDHYEGYGLILSPLARDLVMKLLEVDPRKRITLEEALEHPWLTCERDFQENVIENRDIERDWEVRELRHRQLQEQEQRQRQYQIQHRHGQVQGQGQGHSMSSLPVYRSSQRSSNNNKTQAATPPHMMNQQQQQLHLQFQKQKQQQKLREQEQELQRQKQLLQQHKEQQIVYYE
jgi:serine/threonine protein kinase